jgi:RHS repeat-associated protein
LLARITDVLGMTSEFGYGAGQFLNTLTTPYGTTTFTSGTVSGGGNGSFFVQATDPEGQRERVEFYQGSLGYPHYLPNSEVPRGLATFNRFMDGRNSYYWDKKGYAEAAGDYTKAKNYHWVHYGTTAAAPILETLKEPLEGRVWFNYPGQPTNWGAPYYLNSAYAGAMNKPSIMARILEDGTTQLSTFEYNPLGNMTKSIDPIGRTFSFIYHTNNVDLLEVRMTRDGKNELLRRMTYNAQHQPLTMTDSAGQTTTNTYNSRGQLVSTRNALGHTTTYSYDADGYLISVKGPVSGTTNDLTVSYDTFGRPRAMTFAPGITLTYDYDALDRITRINYPDGTFEQIVYERLDPTAFRDRLGQWTTNTYNAVGQLVQTRDPAGRVTRYSWCACGSPESITDPMGRTTTWRYDPRGRVTAKTYPDGSTVTYEYDSSTGLVKTKRDEQGQLTLYSYYADNNIKEVSYRDTVVPTPSVLFTYDHEYNRVRTIQDGAGLTERSYYPIGIVPTLGAGALQSISGPLPNSAVSYAYDALGRIVSRSINGVGEAWTYDALNRIVAATNALGMFRYSYVDVTRRIASLAYPNGQTNLFAYYGNAGDRRLQSVSHLKPNGTPLSRLGMAYDSVGRITSWTNEWDSIPARVWEFQYDAAGQVATALRKQGAATLSSYNYSYDPAGNRREATLNGTTSRFDYNALNQLVSSQPAPPAPSGYEWDGAQRLTAIVSGGRRTEFSYDALGRRVRVVEKTNGVVLSDTRYLWAGKQVLQARDASGSVVLKRFFPHGEVIHGPANTNLFYFRDHLRSVREVTDAAGNLKSRFDYDPYGQRTVLSAGTEPSFAFAGQFRHSASDLNLTLYRAYDPRLGRWLSRDPLGEAVGLNLYAYVENDPVNFVDPDGDVAVIPFLVGLAIGEAISETATGQDLFGGIYNIYRKVTGSWEEGKRLAELRKYAASGDIGPILQAVIAEIRYLDVSTAQQLSDAAAEAAGLVLPGPNQFPGPSVGPSPSRF